MNALQLVNLGDLMQRTTGRPDVSVGLLDGPVDIHHRDLASQHIGEIGDSPPVRRLRATGDACAHGTFVAGILYAQRGSPAPGDMSRLHAAGSADFFRYGPTQRTPPNRDTV